MRYIKHKLVGILLLMGCHHHSQPRNCIDAAISDRYGIKACGTFSKVELLKENNFIHYNSSSKTYSGGIKVDGLYVSYEFHFAEKRLGTMFISYGSSYGINERRRIEEQVLADSIFFGSNKRFIKDGVVHSFKLHDRGDALDAFIEIGFPN